MPTAVLTDRERTAVQAYLRLLHTVRAALDDTTDDRRDNASDPPHDRFPPMVPPTVLAEAEQALSAAGLTGNEQAFFRLLQSWCPEV